MYKGHAIADFWDVYAPTEEEGRKYDYNRSDGKVCPICRIPILNKAEVCKPHIYEWKAIKSCPRLLAEWIAFEAKGCPALGGVVVWRRKDGAR